MQLASWIAEYADYLRSHGYAASTRSRRLKYLQGLERFVVRQAMNSLEDFTPRHASVLVKDWVEHQPWAQTQCWFEAPLPLSASSPHRLAI